MARTILTKEARLVDKIIRCLPKQDDISEALGRPQQTVSYRIRKVYPALLREVIVLLDLAGYEIREKE